MIVSNLNNKGFTINTGKMKGILYALLQCKLVLIFYALAPSGSSHSGFRSVVKSKNIFGSVHAI